MNRIKINGVEFEVGNGIELRVGIDGVITVKSAAPEMQSISTTINPYYPGYYYVYPTTGVGMRAS